jgi:hypothetical protein
MELIFHPRLCGIKISDCLASLSLRYNSTILVPKSSYQYFLAIRDPKFTTHRQLIHHLLDFLVVFLSNKLLKADLTLYITENLFAAV